MVKGLDIFKEHFKSYSDHYVLIGGTAISLAMENAGAVFRSTKDLDIVLCVELLNTDFVNIFWDFIRKGRYTNQQKSTGKRLFYRFTQPEYDSYPYMLELFSRIPDALSIQNESILTPIPVDEEASSLSAIILDTGYYEFIHSGKTQLDGISYIKPEYIIPLKAKAWLDLTERQSHGDKIDSRDIRKHKYDIFRIYRIIDPVTKVTLADSILKDVRRFFEVMKVDSSFDYKALSFKETEFKESISQMEKIYGI